jgi:hypothetical protein
VPPLHAQAYRLIASCHDAENICMIASCHDVENIGNYWILVTTVRITIHS